MEKNKYIDHTLLKPEATKDMINKLCSEALEHDFASVCVNPTWVSHCAKKLAGSDVMVCTVIGFPLGANTVATKVFEAKDAIANGADEVDTVINIGALKAEDYELVFEDIHQVVEAAKGKTVKVIIETCLLSDEEIEKACRLAVQANADFVKTSTGFSTGGATVEAVKLMKKTVDGKAKVKASGGVRTKEDFDSMVEAGADRIGTSNGVSLI
ncbi:MAG: deoxyribose-phosphate aldolase [Erysipelotrichales bacterium]